MSVQKKFLPQSNEFKNFYLLNTYFVLCTVHVTLFWYFGGQTRKIESLHHKVVYIVFSELSLRAFNFPVHCNFFIGGVVFLLLKTDV